MVKPKPGEIYPPGKEDRVVSILCRWVAGEISSDQVDRELQIIGVKLDIKGRDDNADRN